MLPFRFFPRGGRKARGRFSPASFFFRDLDLAILLSDLPQPHVKVAFSKAFD